MAPLDPESIASIISTCESNSGDIAHAFSRAFGLDLELSVGLATPWGDDGRVEGFEGPGLVLLLLFDQTALAAVLPESTGLVPSWCGRPDARSKARLDALADELSKLMSPLGAAVNGARIVRVASLVEGMNAAAPALNAARVPLVFRIGKEQRGTLSLIWPIRTPDRVNSSLAAPAQNVSKGGAAPPARPEFTGSEDDLPSYMRSLLRIRLPVSVRLASKKQSAEQVLELGIGSIIHFDKSCDDPLQLEVNGQTVAQGEAVKVGDKFGLRIQSVLLPDERFESLKPKR